jgi:hypothetical protein
MTERITSCDICTPHSKKIFCINLLEGRMKYDLEVSNKGIEVEQAIQECPERDIILREVKK